MPEGPAPSGPSGPETPEPVKCPICEEEFDSPVELEEHMKAEHS